MGGGLALRLGAQVERQVVQAAQQDVFRQFKVGVAVPPDVNIRTEETTVDLGDVPVNLKAAFSSA